MAGSDVRGPLLALLYGDDAPAVGARIDHLVARRRRPAEGVAPVPGGAVWSSDDVWLITYADQFQRPGEPPLRTLADIVDRHLEWVNGVHVLPFYPWSSDDGFSVEDYRAVDARYGTWDDVEALAEGRRFMADAVINHMSAEGDWFARFRAGEEPYRSYFRTEAADTDTSLVVRPRTHPLLTPVETADGVRHVWTTFSADQVDLDYASPDLFLEILDVLLDYVDRGADVLRLDAIGFLWKDPTRTSIHLPETHAAIQVMRSVLDEATPGTLLISETNVPHVENISYLKDDPPEVHAVYQFPLAPLVAHAVLTGDVETLVAWADSIDDVLAPGQSFLNFLACHDGIGVRPTEGILDDAGRQVLVDACEAAGGRVSYRSVAGGGQSPYELNTTWFDLLSAGAADDDEAIARHVASHAVMLAMPGVAAIYVHSLFGSSNDAAGFARTGANRQLNRERFDDLAALEGRLADPTSRAARVMAGLGELVAARRSSPAFHPIVPAEVTSPAPGVVRITRRPTEGTPPAIWTINLSSSAAAGLAPYEVAIS
ncbi:MAG: sugar phosphorylase [Acidimicrobiales bacterium]